MDDNSLMRILIIGFFSLAFIFEAQSKEIGTCQCQIAKSPENVVELEEASQCPPDRLYYQNALKKVDPLFSKPRTGKDVTGEFPMSCMAYIMRKYIDASTRASRFYSYCASAAGAPVRPKKTHCVTEEYVTPIYNAYSDILDCLDIPQKDLLPKLYNESGLHLNTLGGGMDAGIGQLTSPAIASVQQLAVFDGKNRTWLDMFRDEISISAKPSCQRIAKNQNLFKKISIESSQRCALIAAPENPLKNVLYMGIFYHYMLRSQTGSRYFKGYTYIPAGDDFERLDHTKKDQLFHGYFLEYKIRDRLVELGLENPNMQAVKQMMVTLGYNSGMESSFIFLDKYLKFRKMNKLKLKPTDFDFQTHFHYNLLKPSKDPAAEKQRQKDLNLAKTAPYRLPFPIFLRMTQKTGAPGYLSHVSNKFLILEKEMGEGICTTKDFLKL